MTTDAQKVARVQTRQVWMRQQGFVEGSRHMVEGNSDYWSADLENMMIPAVLSSLSHYGDTGDFGSPYCPRYYHASSTDVGAASRASIQAALGTPSAPGTVILSGGKYVVFGHLSWPDTQEADLAALETICATNIAPLIASGKAECVTPADAVRKSYA